MLAFVVASTAL